MAEKGFGVKEINLIGASGTPTIESPNNLNLNAVNVAISTNVSIGGTLSVTGNVSVGGTLTYEDVTNIDSVGIITARTGVKVLAGGINVVGVVTATGADINGNSNIAGNLTVEKTSGATELQVKGGESSNAFIHLRADEGDNNGDSWLLKAEASGNDFVIQNDVSGSPVDKFTITTSGAVTATSFSGSGASLTNLPLSNTDVQVLYTVTANGSSAYRFAGNGIVSTEDNPDVYLIRGFKYRFVNNSGGSHPFQIRQSSGGSAYSAGVTNNGASSGNIDFQVPYSAPSHLYYQCTSHGGMVGNLYIRGAGGQNTNVGITTITGGILHINSGTSGDAKLIIEADTDNNEEGDNPFIEFKQDGGLPISAIGHGLQGGDQNGLTIANSVTNGYIRFATGASANDHTSAVVRVSIDSEGTTTFDPNAGGTLKIGGSAAHTSKIVIADNGGTSNGNLLVEGGDGTDFFTIQSNGNVKFENGKGINFGATEGSGATTSVLDDYEEGTFTPTLSGGSSSNTMYYTKIGRIVHISGSLSFSSISGSGTMAIGGLPYTSINGNDSYTHLAAHAYDSLNVGNNTYQFQTLRVDQNSTTIRIIIPAGNGDIRTFGQYSHVSNSTFRFRVAGYYITS